MLDGTKLNSVRSSSLVRCWPGENTSHISHSVTCRVGASQLYGQFRRIEEEIAVQPAEQTTLCPGQADRNGRKNIGEGKEKAKYS